MKGFQISVHPAGMLGILAACLFAPVDKLLTAAAAITLHEVGHYIGMFACGIRRCRIEWTPVGFVAHLDGLHKLSASKRFLIAAAGVAASGVCALFCLLFAAKYRFAYEFLQANFSLWLLNSIPAIPLDGSKMLLAVAEKLGWEQNTEKVLLRISYVLAGGLCLLGFYSAWIGSFNPMPVLLGPYLAYAANAATKTGAIAAIRRLEERKNRSSGQLYPVCAFVTSEKPDQTMFLRAARHCPERAYLLIHQIDRTTGLHKCITTEKQVIDSVFQGHEMSSSAHRHSKTDVIQ